MEIRTQLTHVANRTATDEAGRSYTLVECMEMVSVKALAGWSAWEPRNGHGQHMTLDGKPLDRISSLQWKCWEPNLMLTLKD